MPELSRIWNAKFTVPPVPETDERGYKRWATNHDYAVVAETLEDAVASIRAHFPTATIWSLHHGGKVMASPTGTPDAKPAERTE